MGGRAEAEWAAATEAVKVVAVKEEVARAVGRAAERAVVMVAVMAAALVVVVACSAEVGSAWESGAAEVWGEVVKAWESEVAVE